MNILSKPSKARSAKQSSAPEFWIYESELQCMCRTAAESPGIETGGLLFGAFNGEGMATVAAATPPSSHADHKIYNFQEDVQHANECCHYFLDNFGLFPVGRFHSHHSLELNEPSSGDISTARSWMSRGKFPCFLEIIMTTQGDHVRLNPWLYRRGGRPELGRVYIIPRKSPIRDASYGSIVYPGNAQIMYFFSNERISIAGQPQDQEEKDPFMDYVQEQLNQLPAPAKEKLQAVPSEDQMILSFPLLEPFRGVVVYDKSNMGGASMVLVEDEKSGGTQDLKDHFPLNASLAEIYWNLRLKIRRATASVQEESKQAEPGPSYLDYISKN